MGCDTDEECDSCVGCVTDEPEQAGDVRQRLKKKVVDRGQLKKDSEFIILKYTLSLRYHYIVITLS